MTGRLHQHRSIVLASTSPYRRAILEDAGLLIKAVSPQVDEEARKAEITHLSPLKQAVDLAVYKGQAVAKSHPGHLVIAADQICACNGKTYGKPGTQEAAHAMLMELSGQCVTLYTAICLFEGGIPIWQHVAQPQVTLRAFTKDEASAYIDMEDVTQIAGSCKLEGMGAHLVESIKGEQNAIIGLPLAPLLTELYKRNLLELTPLCSSLD